MKVMIDQAAPLERLPHEVIREPEHTPLVADHFSRYQFCQKFVSGKIVLDAGCGIGYGANLLAQAGAQHVDAIDISPDAIATAQKYYARANVDFKAQDLLSLSASGDYDVVVSFETIEHIADTAKYLQVMQGVLKPDGLFFVSTPNRKVSNPGVTRFDKPRNPFHHAEWTTEEFDQLLSDYFVVEEVYGQHPHYYKGTRIRAIASILKSKRLRNLLHLPEADYLKLARVRPIKFYHEPVFLVAQCRRWRN